jgi:predicted aspartyl protease
VYQIAFTTVHAYGSEREGISVPVELKVGDNSLRLAASIDTGATFCIFRKELADVLGLDPATATVKRFRTANSSFEAFGHEVEIAVLGVTTFSTVYFFADASIKRMFSGESAGWIAYGWGWLTTRRRCILRRTIPNERLVGLSTRGKRVVLATFRRKSHFLQ